MFLNMLTKATAQQLRAMIVLKSHSAWSDFSKLLDGELTALQDRMVYCADEVQMRQLQGRAAAIKELKATVEGSRQSLENLGLQAPL